MTRLVSGAIYPLALPFVAAFRHATRSRTASDSVVVALRDDAGNVGHGEGVARPYVTGETTDGLVAHLRDAVWPALRGRPLPPADLAAIDAFVPELASGALVDHGARCAVTLALVDLVLRAEHRSLAALLPPVRDRVVYSGVVTAGLVDDAVAYARQMKLVGLPHVKLKVGFADDIERVRAVRDVLGSAVSLRLDANGAWTVEQAIEALRALAPFDIACVEQPIAPGSVDDLVRVRAASPIPIMVDESLVTLADARALAAARACDFFNVRVAKHGGLARARAVVEVAAAAGIRVQVGSLVGETAILSAAGRHLAAALPELDFVEGSYGTLLLAEDVAARSVRFGHRGEAPVLSGPGLGVDVRPAVLARYAVEIALG